MFKNKELIKWNKFLFTFSVQNKMTNLQQIYIFFSIWSTRDNHSFKIKSNDYIFILKCASIPYIGSIKWSEIIIM